MENDFVIKLSADNAVFLGFIEKDSVVHQWSI